MTTGSSTVRLNVTRLEAYVNQEGQDKVANNQLLEDKREWAGL